MIHDRFRIFLERQDPVLLVEAASPGTWISSMVMFALLALLPQLEGVQATWSMPWFEPVMIAVVVCVPGFISAMLFRAGKLPFPWAVATLVIVAGLITHMFAAWTVLSSGPGAAIPGGIALLCAAYYGQMLRSTAREPFGVLSVTLGLAGAYFWNPNPNSLVFIATLAPTGAFLHLLVGYREVKVIELKAQEKQMRDALQAAEMAQMHQRLSRQEEQIVAMLGVAHDVSNQVTMPVHAFDMTRMYLSEPDDGLKTLLEDTLEKGQKSLIDAAENLRGALKAVRDSAKTADAGRISVNLRETSTACIERVRIAYPHVHFELDDAQLERDTITIHNEHDLLTRAVENLLINAVQGDGDRGATAIRLVLTTDDDNTRVTVEDNGPGFTEDILAKPISLFTTTKSSGAGVGLFTCAQFARSNSGSLLRGVSPDGGASVTLVLPEPEPPSAPATP